MFWWCQKTLGIIYLFTIILLQINDQFAVSLRNEFLMSRETYWSNLKLPKWPDHHFCCIKTWLEDASMDYVFYDKVFCTAFKKSRFSVLCASLVFSKNIVPGIGRMPRSLKIGIEAARLLQKEISQIFVALSAWN